MSETVDDPAIAETGERFTSGDRLTDPQRALQAASRTLDAIARLLPGEELQLFFDEALGALAVIEEHDPQLCEMYRRVIRDRAGPAILARLDRAFARFRGTVGTLGREPLRLVSPLEVTMRPRRPDIVRGILPAQGIAVLQGAPGSGKSFLADHIALRLAAAAAPIPGRRFRKTAAVIVAAEGTRSMRLLAHSEAFQVDLARLPVRLLERAIDLRQGGDAVELIAQIRDAEDAIGRVGLVVVDTLARTFGGGEENSSEAMGAYLRNVERIAAATGGLVLLLHHCGKDAHRGGRGHSSLLGALDAELTVTRADDGVRTATLTKSRDGADGVAFAFRLEAVDLGPDPDGDPGDRLTSCVIAHCEQAPARWTPPRGKNQARAYDAIAGALAAGQMLLEAEAVRLVQKGCEMPRQRAWEAVRGLIDGGFLRRGAMGPLEIVKETI